MSATLQSIFQNSEQLLRECTQTEKGPKILFATGIGGHPVATLVDGLVASACWLRGAKVEFLLCDGVLPACEVTTFHQFQDQSEFLNFGPRRTLCENCVRCGNASYEGLPFPLHRYSAFVDLPRLQPLLESSIHLSREECFQYSYEGLPLGEQVRAGLLRYLGKANFEGEDEEFIVHLTRRYMQGALVAAHVFENAIERLRPDIVSAHHGIYVPQGVLGLIARKKGVRVVNWCPSYRNTTVIYSHDDTYHKTIMDEPIALWENRALSQENLQLEEYLWARRAGKGDWTWITPERGEKVLYEEKEKLISELSLDMNKPVYGLLTNVLWDAQLFYTNVAFPNMLDWLFDTMDYFIANPDKQLIIRIHPHEVKAGNRQPSGPAIRARYPHLPSNIKIVDRESPFSTYALMDLCRAVIIYATKTGVELTPFGIPVITAGDAWIRYKDITIDPKSREEYFRILENIDDIQPLPHSTRERAKRYAYHYFFRRMIPIRSLDPDAGFPPRYTIQSLEDILPGKDKGLDTICHGIMSCEPFVHEP